MADLTNSLEKGKVIQLEEGKFPVENAKFIGRDCGGFLHLIGESHKNIYGIFLKERGCFFEENKLKYNGTITSWNMGCVNPDSCFGQELKQKYFKN